MEDREKKSFQMNGMECNTSDYTFHFKIQCSYWGYITLTVLDENAKNAKVSETTYAFLIKTLSCYSKFYCEIIG